MHHVMFLLTALLVVVSCTVKHQVSGLHLLKLKVDRKCVKLVRLVPTIKLEPEIFSQIVYDLADECTAIEEDWRIVKRLSRAVVSLCVWYAKVLDASIYKLLPEHLLEGWITSILLRLGGHVVAILDFLLLGLSKPLKVRLQSARFQASTEAE